MRRGDRTASEGHEERRGVCRDFAHLAVTLSRCMNIPARYCTGYLGDIGVSVDPAPMDFSAWYEVFLEGRWFTFDARHNHPRIGRIVIAKGRDAADVAIQPPLVLLSWRGSRWLPTSSRTKSRIRG
jgi:transglutaminase-like putative cysteine protease